MSTSADEFVLQLARERGWLRDEQVAAAGGTLATLIENGAIDAARATRWRADAFGMSVVELDGVRVECDVLAMVPRALAVKHRMIPLSRDERRVRVAVGDPLDTDGIDLLAHVSGLAVEAQLASLEKVMAAIERHYGKDETSLERSIGELSAENVEGNASIEVDEPVSESAADADDAPIIQLVHSIIVEAVRRRASDIHLEPLEKRFRVRYRVDGVLLDAPGPAKRVQLAVISRVKIMANISIAEKRVPQDGRIQIAIGGRTLDLRVSSLPTAHGESIVMRILDKEGLQLGLPELGFLEDDRAQFERLVRLPDGIVLVTGPTGSGKTTTLYSCLHHLNQSDRKIITVEDPVEYQLTGINQVPVRQEIGMTFASALRAMLRQAPNVVMIGEIRDLETAEIAINASMTGHMVFSTLHTNDAPGAVTRLMDLGVKPFLVATSLRATMAQRLVRKICEKCRRPHVPSAREAQALGLDEEMLARATFARGTGCAACNGTGYRGRVGIFEIFAVNAELQRMIHERASAASLRAKARTLGMRTMREDGVRKASAGLTTIEEVVSITVGDES